jgi:glycine cleavage system aminomethyltransferase T
VHEHLKGRAVFGEVAGWERANWFADPGQAREYRYGWHRQNWFENSRAEHMAVRQGVGLFDMTSFGKIRVEGRDAAAFLNHVCANEMDVPAGPRRLHPDAEREGRHRKRPDRDAAFGDRVPAGRSRRDAATGPRLAPRASRRPLRHDHGHDGGRGRVLRHGAEGANLLQECSPDDLTNAAFPFATAREIEIGMGLARAHRISYVGELGWELYVSTDQAAHVFETLTEAGANHDLKLCGLHALDSCRIEKAFRHFGHDITDEDHVLEAGLGFAVRTQKPDFIGRDAVLRKREEGLARRMVQFQLTDPEPMLFHNEAVVRDGEIVSIVTSGNYGHALGGAIGMGYVPCPGETAEDVLGSTYEIEVAGVRHAAKAIHR